MHTQKYDLLKRSEILQQHEELNPDLTTSSTAFASLICPFMQQPSEVSCVSVAMLSLSHVMWCLSERGLNNSSFSESLSNCACPIRTRINNFESRLKLNKEQFDIR